MTRKQEHQEEVIADLERRREMARKEIRNLNDKIER